MKRYKLKEDFAGKKAGEIFIQSSLYRNPTWSYKGCKIILDQDSELLEEVKDKPLFYTNEDEVYFDGKKIPIYSGIYYLVTGNTVSRSKVYPPSSPKDFLLDGIKDNKRFLTEQAAEDYIKLQQAIKDSGLKVGDTKQSAKYIDWTSVQTSYILNFTKTQGQFDDIEISRFVILNSTPCVIIKAFRERYEYAISLKQFSKSKLLFGDKEINLSLRHSNVLIECQGLASDYVTCKEFRRAISTIQNFKFGTYSYYSPDMFHLFRIGCTTGTLEQIDKILEECEKLLKS